MSTNTVHCKVDYHQYNGTDLDGFAHLVSEGIYTNSTTFTAPPYTQIVFDGYVNTFHDKYEAYKNGGKAQKGAYTIARTNLMKALDDTAEYVDGLPDLDEGTIELAGYKPTKTSDTKAVAPATPTNIVLTHGATGEIKAECDAVPGRDITYGCLMVAGSMLPPGISISNAGQIIIIKDTGSDKSVSGSGGISFIIDLNKSRKKHFTGLTKGVEYFFYFYASNSAGVSQLSEVRSLVCN